MKTPITAFANLFTDVAFTSVAQGDIVYRGAAKWNNLAAPGVSGSYYLAHDGVGGNPSWGNAAALGSPFDDANAILYGSSDNTKLLRFELGGFTSGATRVLTPPNADATIAGLEIAQTFTAQQIFETGAAGASPVIFRQTGGTPGTNEGQIGHSGGVFKVESKAGGMTFWIPVGQIYSFTSAGSRLDYNNIYHYSGTVQLSGSSLGLRRGYANVGFTVSEAYTSHDTRIDSPSPGVIEINKGVTGQYGALICGQPAIGTIGARVIGKASASVNALQVESEAGTTLFGVKNDGVIALGGSSTIDAVGQYYLQATTNGDQIIRNYNTSTGTGARSYFYAWNDRGAGMHFGVTGSAYAGISGWADCGYLSCDGSITGGMLLNAQSGPIRFMSATTEKMRVDSSGIWFGTHSAIGAETVTGYITIKDSGGTTRKLAVVS